MSGRKESLGFEEWRELLESVHAKVTRIKPDGFTRSVLDQRLLGARQKDWTDYGPNGWFRKQDAKERRRAVVEGAKGLDAKARADALQYVTDMLLRLHQVLASELQYFFFGDATPQDYAVTVATRSAISEAVTAFSDVAEATARSREPIEERVAQALLLGLSRAVLLAAASIGRDVEYPFLAVARLLARHPFERVESAKGILQTIDAGIELFPMDSSENRELRKALAGEAAKIRETLGVPPRDDGTKPLAAPFKYAELYKLFDAELGPALRAAGFERIKCGPSRWQGDGPSGRTFFCIEGGKWGWSAEGGGEFSVSAYHAPPGTAWKDVDTIQHAVDAFDGWSDEDYAPVLAVQKATVKRIKSLRFTDAFSKMLHESRLSMLDFAPPDRDDVTVNPSFLYYGPEEARAYAQAFLAHLPATLARIASAPKYAFSESARSPRP